MPIELAPDSLVVLIGASGSGKSYWAHTFFRDTQVVSSDRCRALVSDDEENQTVNREAFAVFYSILRQRLLLGRLTVADSTGLQEFSRRRMLGLAREHARPAHALLFLAPPDALLRNNRERTRRVPDEVLLRHAAAIAALAQPALLEAEGYDSVHRLEFPYDLQTAPRLVRPVPPGQPT